jgi:Xaa-Pro aminopeptidase
MNEENLDAVLLTSAVNCYYYSGFSGSSRIVLIENDGSLFFTDFRYGDQAHQQVLDHEVAVVDQPLLNSAVKRLKAAKPARLGLEFSRMNVNDFFQLKESLPETAFVDVDGFISEARMIKDETEISCIRKGMEIVDETFSHILTFIREGITEKEIALELEYQMKKRGADGIKENHVIASGERSCLPHGQATGRVIQRGDFVKMDFGAKVNGYYTDFTRTVIVGEASDKQLEIYHIVKTAQEISLAAVGPGKSCSELDQIGRSVIREAGYGEQFGHSLGHALGLEIHEKPAMRSTDDTILRPGMVLTVEPGVYIPGFGGVRIEDLIVIRDNGIENLTTSTKELQII